MRRAQKLKLEEAMERQRAAEHSKIENAIAIERQRRARTAARGADGQAGWRLRPRSLPLTSLDTFAAARSCRAEEEIQRTLDEGMAGLRAEKQQLQEDLHQTKLELIGTQHEMQQQAALIKQLQNQVQSMKVEMEVGGFDPMVKILKNELRGYEDRIVVSISAGHVSWEPGLPPAPLTWGLTPVRLGLAGDELARAEKGRGALHVGGRAQDAADPAGLCADREGAGREEGEGQGEKDPGGRGGRAPAAAGASC